MLGRMNVRRLAGELTALLFDHDKAALEARLAEWRRAAASGREAEVLAKLADHALGLKPMLDAGALSREELGEALELMLRLAMEGGKPVG